MCIQMIFSPPMAKDAGLRIRVEKELREAFVTACRRQNVAASEVLREFMSAFAKRQSEGAQANLFPLIGNKSSDP